MRNYNLFCRPDRAELVCAVPEDRAVPAFITGPNWKFVGRVMESTIGFLSFNHEVAEASVHFNGFYLFQLINASDLQRKIGRDRVKTADLAPGWDTDHRQRWPARQNETWLAPC